MSGTSRRSAAGERSIGRLLIAAVATGFALLLAAGIAAVWVAGRTREHSSWVAHTLRVQGALEHTQVLIEQAEATRRGYLLTGHAELREASRRFDAQVEPSLRQVERLTRDNALQQEMLVAYRQRIEALEAARRQSIAVFDAGRRDEAIALFTRDGVLKRSRGIRDLVARMLGEEQRLLAYRDASERQSLRLFYLILAGAGVLLVGVAAATTVTLLRFTRDLRVSRDELRQLNSSLEAQVDERTADLSRANEEIQRFAYIVSHDLRSPLVNVMGFTSELEAATRELAALIDRAEAEAPQLLTADARLAVREDLPEAIGFIRTSTQRMDRLINAILRLSREGRRNLSPEPLDIAEIADTAVATLRQQIDGKGASVDVQHPMPTLVGDRVAVEQILANLIENAIKYLQPGRPGQVSVIGYQERGRVVIAVVDNGRGIAPADHARVFDLFRRSGAQDQPGEGIGLAHVRALAYRLGGTIDLESKLGEGSTFKLTLPALFQGSRA